VSDTDQLYLNVTVEICAVEPVQGGANLIPYPEASDPESLLLECADLSEAEALKQATLNAVRGDGVDEGWRTVTGS
jgi:hypothetical protein